MKPRIFANDQRLAEAATECVNDTQVHLWLSSCGVAVGHWVFPIRNVAVKLRGGRRVHDVTISFEGMDHPLGMMCREDLRVIQGRVITTNTLTIRGDTWQR